MSTGIHNGDVVRFNWKNKTKWNPKSWVVWINVGDNRVHVTCIWFGAELAVSTWAAWESYAFHVCPFCTQNKYINANSDDKSYSQLFKPLHTIRFIISSIRFTSLLAKRSFYGKWWMEMEARLRFNEVVQRRQQSL